jgi:hypothetical protein
MARDAIYYLAPTRATHSTTRQLVVNGWRVVKVLEHGPYHDQRPKSWRGPYATAIGAMSVAAGGDE